MTNCLNFNNFHQHSNGNTSIRVISEQTNNNGSVTFHRGCNLRIEQRVQVSPSFDCKHSRTPVSIESRSFRANHRYRSYGN